MHLSIYVYGQLGLTLDLRNREVPLPARAVVCEGPGFKRLTATPANLRQPGRLHQWLRAFLPENGAIAPYLIIAQRRWPEQNLEDPGGPAPILWGNTDAEFTGAVDFRQTDANPPETIAAPDASNHVDISDQEIRRRLEQATALADSTAGTGLADVLEASGRRSSLSGMRGKLSLTRRPDGSWCHAHGQALNTWIVKHEHRHDLPGEAGLEAITQRALRLVGIPAAKTAAAIFDGAQAVISKRSDRQAERDGTVSAQHQEEWIQAACWRPNDKYDDKLGPGPQWPDAYRLLHEHSKDAHGQTTHLTRALASAWMLGHGDFHRRNLGFLHAPATAEAGITLAPLYDFSSAADTRYSPCLAVSMDGVDRPDLITPTRWQEHSRACGVPEDVTYAVIDELFATLPDAVSTAREQAKTIDENLLQDDVDRRIDATIAYIQARERAYRSQQDLASKRKLHLSEGETSRMGRKLREAIDANPAGTVSQKPSPNSTSLAIRYIPPQDGTPEVAIGTAQSARQAAAVIASAGAARAEDIPQLELTIETERARAVARSISRG